MKKIFFLIILCLFIITGCTDNSDVLQEQIIPKDDAEVIVEKVKIIDYESNTRPYAVVINNFPSAVKVQSGLNDAYIVYEFPIEGGITRSLALYKDKTDVKIGTVRSARHDYLDYVLENDAIFVHFGWSHTAQEDIFKLGIDYIDGNTRDYNAFWRENPESIATEHTVYTNLSKIIDYNENNRKYRDTTEVKPSLNYVTKEITLNDDDLMANNVEISYSNAFSVGFKYNDVTGKYDRSVNGVGNFDYFTKEQYNTKNIIIIFLDYGYVTTAADAAGNNYLDLYNVGTGRGYYVTNGYAKEINWSKEDRSSQTKYTYLDGTEIEVNDGNTWIMFCSNSRGVKLS